MNRLILLFCAALMSGYAYAADVVWTNTAGGNWGTAANWSPNQAPGADDNALILANGTYTVTVNVAATVASLQVSGTGTRTLTLSGNTLTVNGDSLLDTNCIFNFSSGTLAGNGNITIAGTLNYG